MTGTPGTTGRRSSRAGRAAAGRSQVRFTRGAFLLVVGLIAAKAALALWLVAGSVKWYAVGFEALFVVAVLGVLDAVLFRWRPVTYLVADAVLTFALLATVLYASYFDQVLTPVAIGMAGEAGQVGSSITALFEPSQLLFVADLAILGVAFFLTRSRFSRAFDPLVAGAGAAALIAETLVVASIVRVPGSIDGMTTARARGLFAYQLASTMRDEERAAQAVASTGSSAGIAAAITSDTASAESSAAVRIGGVQPGVARGTNVIIIQVEALQNLAANRSIDGVTITPNFDRFAAENYYFPNAFSQMAKGNTSDVEFVVDTSLYPPLEKAASLTYVNRELPGLPRVLGAERYRTMTFHTNDAEFWNRTQLYPALGYARYYDRDFFGNRDILGMGPSDEVLFSAAAKEIERQAEQGRPVFAQIVTLSSHHPFDPMPEKKDPWVPGPPYAGTFVGRYLSRINYADRALGDFLAELKRSGLYDTSVIVIYGDHFAIKNPETKGPEKAAQEALAGRPYTAVDRLRIPLAIHIPGQSGSVVSTPPVSQLDIAPTVTELLGVDTSGTASFGRSVFAGGPRLFGIASAPLGAFVNDRVYFTPGTGFADGAAFSVVDGAQVPVQPSDEADYEAAKQMRQLSAAYIATLPKRSGPLVDPKARIPGNRK